MPFLSAPRAPSSPSRALLLFVSLSAVLATFVATPLAHAGAGCFDAAGVCVASSGTGPCDASCPSGYCVGDRCMHPEDCDRPCGTAAGECPPITIGNNVFRPEGAAEADGGCFYGTGCGPLIVSPTAVTTNPSTPQCLHVGDVGVSAYLHGDCDQDQVPNVAEGTGKFCSPQMYVGPGRTTTTPTCPGTCTAACVSGFEPHGGVVCSSEGAGAYHCMIAADCPSTFDRRVSECVVLAAMGSTRLGLCLYRDVCGSTMSCFDFTAPVSDAAGWIESAYAAGDCDDDGTTNDEDPADCGTKLVEWSADGDPFHGAPAPTCPDSSACRDGVCSTTLEVCATGDSIGVACDPSEDPIEACTALLGRDAQCVFAGNTTDTAVGICVPIGPEDDLCRLRGSDCFARGVDPAHAYDEGDCDGDGLANAIDDAVCTVFTPDAGTGANTDGGASANDDASVVEADAGSASMNDSGSTTSGPDAGAPGTFAGSGCGCRAHEARAHERTALGTLLVLAFGLVRRRARRHANAG